MKCRKTNLDLVWEIIHTCRIVAYLTISAVLDLDVHILPTIINVFVIVTHFVRVYMVYATTDFRPTRRGAVLGSRQF